MKVRIVAVVVGVMALFGVGASPASAAPVGDMCSILYPFCG